MIQLPINVFVGYTTGIELLATLAMQLAWAAVLFSACTPRSCVERESWSCRVAVPTLYARLVSARVRVQWQYRTSFVLDFVGVFLVTFLDFLAILVIFHNVPQLGGWTVQEVALLYGISGLAVALAGLAVGQLDLLSQLIRDGNFDLVLIRPRRSLLQVLASDFHLRRLGRVAQAHQQARHRGTLESLRRLASGYSAFVLRVFRAAGQSLSCYACGSRPARCRRCRPRQVVAP